MQIYHRIIMTSQASAVHCIETAQNVQITQIYSFFFFAGPLWLSGLNHRLGHSACWPDGLMALAGLGSNPGLEGSFSARLG